MSKIITLQYGRLKAYVMAGSNDVAGSGSRTRQERANSFTEADVRKARKGFNELI